MRAFIYDTETSGLPSNRTVNIDKLPYVIEFFGHTVDLKTAKRTKPIHHLIKPPTKSHLTPEITKITTITWDDLKDQGPMKSVFREIKKAIEGHDTIIAHNLAFDMEMMNIEAERLGHEIIWPKRKICTVEQTEHLVGYRMKLSDLHEFLLGRRFDGAHRANVDVDALTNCAVKLFERGEL